MIYLGDVGRKNDQFPTISVVQQTQSTRISAFHKPTYILYITVHCSGKKSHNLHNLGMIATWQHIYTAIDTPYVSGLVGEVGIVQIAAL